MKYLTPELYVKINVAQDDDVESLYEQWNAAGANARARFASGLPHVPAPFHRRDSRQHAGQEALHVRRAPAVEPPVAFGHDEGIARPDLAVHRHAVGVAAEDEAAVALAADGRPEVGLATGRVVDQRRVDPEPGEIVA